jgi:hypothetical protein
MRHARTYAWTLVTLITLLGLPGLAQARTFWVSTSGTDSNGCTDSAAPLALSAMNQTITGTSGGLACLTQAGDTLRIMPGTYTTGEVTWATNNTARNLDIANGTASAYTTVRGHDPANRPVFQPRGPGSQGQGTAEANGGGIRFLKAGGDFYINVSHIIIDGTTVSANSGRIGRGILFGDDTHHIRMDNFILRDFHETIDIPQGTTATKASGLLVSSGAHHHHISNCEIHNIGNSFETAAHQIYWAGNDSIFEDCYVHDAVGDKLASFYASSPASDGTDSQGGTNYSTPDRNIIRRNRFIRGSTKNTHLLVLEGQDNQFYDNIVRGGPGTGACMTLGFGPTNRRNLIYNNVFYDCDTDGITIGDSGTTTSHTTIKNNIFKDSTGAPIRVGSNNSVAPGVTNTYISYNTWHGNGTNSVVINPNAGANVIQSNNITTNPNFTNAAANDFTLLDGSPSIDTGTNTICTSSDVSGGRCATIVNASSPNGTRDRGRWEKGGGTGPIDIGPLISRHLLNNNATSTVNSFTGTASNVVYETNTPDPAEGTHSAFFNGTTSYISVPTTGHDIAAQSRCAAFYAEALVGTHSIFEQRTTAPSANRFGVYHNGASVRVEIGAAGNLLTSLALVVGEWNYVCLIHSGSGGSGSWRLVSRHPSTHELTEVGSGSYTGLSQIPSTWTIGNFDVGDTGAFNGNIDAVSSYNIALSDADILADCEVVFGVGECTEGTAPVFVDPNLSAGANDASGLFLAATFATGPVNPSLCLVPANFLLKYDAVAQGWTNCTINNTALTLAPTAPPASNTVVITLENTTAVIEDLITLTNNYNPPATTADLEQGTGACRYDGSDDSQVWETACDMPSGGWREFRIPINNVGGSTAAAQAYALYCARSNPVVAEMRVTDDCDGVLGLCYKALAAGDIGIADGELVADHVGLGAGTFQDGGVVRRADQTTVQVAVEAAKHVEMGYLVRKSSAVAVGDTHTCRVRSSSGAALSASVPIISNTVRPRYVRR